MPTIDQMYETDELRIGSPAVRGYILEGEKCPGHFDGMLQVVMKLLNLSGASRAYFGKKDAQKLVLIEQIMAGELDSERLKAQMQEVLSQADAVEYVAIVDREFNAIQQVEIGNTIILLAAWVGKPRLIDNIWV